MTPFDEMLMAMRKLNCGTAGGRSGIVPEIILHGGAALHRRLHHLFLKIWDSGAVVSDWRDADVVPIPKKGDLRLCDNWRGISLLDVVGKLFARVMQDRLQVLAEDVLPDSQCSFRKGRGCVDMMFVAQQLYEKSIEHSSGLYVLFVDLKKAYDSVLRAALRLVLQRLGVPPQMLRLIQSLHENMEARVRVGDGFTDPIMVRNGLRQGCTLAPTLFNLYFCAVVAYWRSRSSVPGVQVRFRIGRRLVGDRTAKSHLDSTSITESQFADDAALYTTSFPHLAVMSDEFVSCGSRWGLTVSIEKTKALIVNSPEQVPPSEISLGDRGRIDVVHQFTYLGGVVADDGSLTLEQTSRLAKAWRAFGALLQPIFLHPSLSLSLSRPSALSTSPPPFSVSCFTALRLGLLRQSMSAV